MSTNPDVPSQKTHQPTRINIEISLPNNPDSWPHMHTLWASLIIIWIWLTGETFSLENKLMNAKRSCHFLKYAHKYARMMKNQENMVLTNKSTEFF